MSNTIDVRAKPGVVLLEVVVGPLSFSMAIKPRDADSLASAFQRAAIEANAPKLALVRPEALPPDTSPAVSLVLAANK